MPTKTTMQDALKVRWQERGLTEQQADDMAAIAAELATVTGKPIGSCLEDVNKRVTEVLTERLLARINDTITYGSDLGK
jgi:hypothetical protein